MKLAIALKFFPNVSLFVRVKLLIENHFVCTKYLAKALLGVLFSSLLLPFEIFETLKYKKIIRLTNIKKSPIFIIGFWRSGTTHLHNLMIQDAQFGYVSQFAVTFPRSFIGNYWLKDIISHFIPDTRPMDNVELSFDVPQEEEFALCNMTPYSFYHALLYPKKSYVYFDRYVLFKDVDLEIIKKLKSAYLYFLKKITYVSNNKQLILKNPVNTGRIKLLLEMFPDAKFIHIYRNPYDVYQSGLNLYNKIAEEPRLQDVPDGPEVGESLIYRYKMMMEKYFEDSKLIPAGNLMEVKYEELIESPLEILEKIYEQLGLSGIDEAKDRIKDYLTNIKSYRRNKFRLTPEITKKVRERFGFALEKWGYDVPES